MRCSSPISIRRRLHNRIDFSTVTDGGVNVQISRNVIPEFPLPQATWYNSTAPRPTSALHRLEASPYAVLAAGFSLFWSWSMRPTRGRQGRSTIASRSRMAAITDGSSNVIAAAEQIIPAGDFYGKLAISVYLGTPGVVLTASFGTGCRQSFRRSAARLHRNDDDERQLQREHEVAQRRDGADYRRHPQPRTRPAEHHHRLLAAAGPEPAAVSGPPAASTLEEGACTPSMTVPASSSSPAASTPPDLAASAAEADGKPVGEFCCQGRNRRHGGGKTPPGVLPHHLAGHQSAFIRHRSPGLGSSVPRSLRSPSLRCLSAIASGVMLGLLVLSAVGCGSSSVAPTISADRIGETAQDQVIAEHGSGETPGADLDGVRAEQPPRGRPRRRPGPAAQRPTPRSGRKSHGKMIQMLDCSEKAS